MKIAHFSALTNFLLSQNILEDPRHTTREPPVWFELEANCFQFYAIANLDKTSQITYLGGMPILPHKIYSTW